jgi:phosphoribosyl-AMP cyclohydrolase
VKGDGMRAWPAWPDPGDDARLVEWVRRLRAEEPGAVAVLLSGSRARGDAGAYSDLDLEVLTRGAPAGGDRALLLARGDGRLAHVSIGVTELEEWLAARRARARGRWSFGLPARAPWRALWAAPGVAPLLADVPVHAAEPPELEDLVEDAGKVKNARAAGDELALRLAAHDLAAECPALLGPLNPRPPVSSRREALAAALDMPVAPPGYREDMLTCLGLTGRTTPADKVYAAAMRLALGVVDVLRAHAPALAPLLGPDLAGLLADGRLRRYLAQGVEPGVLSGEPDRAGER